MQTAGEQRKILMKTLFPEGIPRLWCPLLTHYKADGSIDRKRISAHIARIRPWIAAVLAPGSTGDGWEMDEAETGELLGFLADEAIRQNFSIMAGILRTQPGTVVPAIQALLDRFAKGRAGAEALAACNICGFTVTPPKGANLTQKFIHAELETVARTGAPVALYQLPQITQNEMSPETVESLASRYPNIYLMKDTSGKDRVAKSGRDFANLFLVRGAEGDYARWARAGGGCYDGFLLSTANCFAKELSTMLDRLVNGSIVEAEVLSGRITRVISAVLEAASSLSFGNAFANANKAIDHHFAWGKEAADQPAPMTHSGKRIPASLIACALDHLVAEGFDMGPGYMNSLPAGNRHRKVSLWNQKLQKL